MREELSNAQLQERVSTTWFYHETGRTINVDAFSRTALQEIQISTSALREQEDVSSPLTGNHIKLSPIGTPLHIHDFYRIPLSDVRRSLQIGNQKLVSS